MNLLRQDAADTCATTDALTEPTSETMAPDLSARAIAFAASPEAPTGMAEDDAVGVPRRLCRVGVVAVAEVQLVGALEGRSGAAVDRDMPG